VEVRRGCEQGAGISVPDLPTDHPGTPQERSHALPSVKASLDQLTDGRDQVLAELTQAAHDAGSAALVLFGSLGGGAGDAFSDLDLIAHAGQYMAWFDLQKVGYADA